ncbi:MAG: MotA/TolQ/ExbB proton channel family protein [Verrucomicrobiota bacterium]
MLANAVVEWFVKGGPIMWPILVVAIVMVAVIVERSVFWLLLKGRRDAATLEKVLAAMENTDFRAAVNVSQGSTDPVVRMIHQGLTHVHGSLTGALQVAAGVEIKRAGRFMVLIDTCITLAPLLGLLGTVTGIMKSFQEVVGELAVQAVSAGIGEALIATAAGLAIAIAGVFFLNFYNELLAKLQFELETAATNVDVMVARAKLEGFDTMAFRRETAANRA